MDGRDKKIFKIGVCGPKASGKTSLASRLAGNPEIDPPPTIGVEFYSRSIPGSDLKLHFWDLAGGRQYVYITDMYIARLDLMLYVYDVRQRGQQGELVELYKEYNDKTATRKAVIVGTHADIGGQLDTGVIDQLVAANSLPHIMVSSKTGQNIDALSHEIVGSYPRLPVAASAPQVRKTAGQKGDKCTLL